MVRLARVGVIPSAWKKRRPCEAAGAGVWKIALAWHSRSGQTAVSYKGVRSSCCEDLAMWPKPRRGSLD